MVRFILLLSSIIAVISPPSAYCMQEEQSYIVEEIRESEAKYPRQTLAYREETETTSSSNQSEQMKFKLGFEFQEINGLCPWALNNNNIQKKPIFYFKDKVADQRLWKVVIDTTDIEFVTEPFTHKERLQVEKAIDTLGYAFQVLQGLLKSHASITFEQWLDEMEGLLRGSTNNSYLLGYFANYTSVRDQFIVRPSQQWTPRFSPQATIQHPLEYTIPLYFGLFGFDSRYMPQFSASLPCRDLFLNAQKEANSSNFGKFVQGFQQKMNGLVFLHALTLVQMTSEDDPDDKDLLEETYNNLTQYSQFDAKMKFTIMSRRPFSSMFEDIHTQGSYATYFNLAMRHNIGFYKIPSLFYKTNYAEQFFDPQSGTAKSLLHLLPLFRKDFLEQNQETLNKLLKQGVLSTTMIRKFKKDVQVDNSFPVSALFNKYYEMAVKTVDNPKNTFIIDVDNGTIQSVPFAYDVLSPPCFLDFDNSMGRFKKKLTEEERQYGEAIVEVRGIRDVQTWFLNKCALDSGLTGHFLTNPGPGLKQQALCLFNFLTNFGIPTDTVEIFYLGMPFALRKY